MQRVLMIAGGNNLEKLVGALTAVTGIRSYTTPVRCLFLPQYDYEQEDHIGGWIADLLLQTGIDLILVGGLAQSCKNIDEDMYGYYQISKVDNILAEIETKFVSLEPKFDTFIKKTRCDSLRLDDVEDIELNIKQILRFMNYSPHEIDDMIVEVNEYFIRLSAGSAACCF